RLGYYSTPDGVKRVVRWDPCHTITYRVNLTYSGSTAGQKAAALKDVKTAVAKLSAVTGIPFYYEGATTQIPTSASWWQRQTSADLVIAWVDQTRTATRSTLLGKDPSGRWTSGTGGHVFKYWSSGGKWQLASGRGYVVLDAAQRGKYRAGFGSGVTRGSLLLHELGHVVGLEHVGAVTETMYPVIRSRSAASYYAGDRAGLAKLGRSAGCIAVPAAVWPVI
ncbi:MAG: matrixin family metalloprotease, partial [Nocardioidaceae bacterium]